MNNKNIYCECGLSFDEDTFENHFKICIIFKNRYEDFDYKLMLLLKKYSIDYNSLIHLKNILQGWIKLIDKNAKSCLVFNSFNSHKRKKENVVKKKNVEEKMIEGEKIRNMFFQEKIKQNNKKRKNIVWNNVKFSILDNIMYKPLEDEKAKIKEIFDELERKYYISSLIPEEEIKDKIIELKFDKSLINNWANNIW